jgi:hypothetical protein
MFVWHPEKVGDVHKIVQMCLSRGVTALAFKHDDGGQPFSDRESSFGLNGQVIEAYRDELHKWRMGFGLWGYHYGVALADEAAMVGRAASFKPDFYIIDWESEFNHNQEHNVEGMVRDYVEPIVAYRNLLAPDMAIYHAPLPQPRYWASRLYQVLSYCFEGMIPQIYHKAMELDLDDALQLAYQDYADYGLTAKPIYPCGQVYDVPADDVLAWGTRAVDVYGAKALGWWSLEHAGPDHMLAVSHIALGGRDDVRRKNGIHPDYRAEDRKVLEVGSIGIPCREPFGLLATDRRIVIDLTVEPIPGKPAPSVVVKDGDCSYAGSLDPFNGFHQQVAVYMHSAPHGNIILEVRNGPARVTQFGILEAGS